jgi:hypothetical protein
VRRDGEIHPWGFFQARPLLAKLGVERCLIRSFPCRTPHPSVFAGRAISLLGTLAALTGLIGMAHALNPALAGAAYVECNAENWLHCGENGSGDGGSGDGGVGGVGGDAGGGGWNGGGDDGSGSGVDDGGIGDDGGSGAGDDGSGPGDDGSGVDDGASGVGDEDPGDGSGDDAGDDGDTSNGDQSTDSTDQGADASADQVTPAPAPQPSNDFSDVFAQLQKQWRQQAMDQMGDPEKHMLKALERQGFTPFFGPNGHIMYYCDEPIQDVLTSHPGDPDAGIKEACFVNPMDGPTGPMPDPHRKRHKPRKNR